MCVFQVRQKALIMAEMMSFQQKRQEEDYKIAEEIEDLGLEMSKYVQKHVIIKCCELMKPSFVLYYK